jgi:hypothetical protein
VASSEPAWMATGFFVARLMFSRRGCGRCRRHCGSCDGNIRLIFTAEPAWSKTGSGGVRGSDDGRGSVGGGVV